MNKNTFINVALCPLLFFLIALAIISIPDAPEFFRYKQIEIHNGQWWRFVTAHFTHTTWNHFFLNMSGLGIMAYLFAQVSTWKNWLVIMLVGSIFCSTCFYFFGDEDYNYVGMSDILHTAIVAYAMLDFKYFKIGNAILIVGTLAKVIWEQSPWYIETTAELIGGKVATDSHLYGTLIGLILGGLLLWMRFRREG